MSTATEISRLQAARNTIRNKLITLGLATSTDKLDSLADAIDGISNQGAISASVQEGDTYTIPQGYHNGSGTVSGIAGGGNYQLQAKGPITPTKNQISVSPDNGYYGLSAVTVDAIPEAYQDVSAVTAEASQVLATKIFVTSDGTITTGTMPNNGAVSQTLTAASTSYTVPSGYHNGSGTVSIVTETKSATPSTASQDVTPTSGKVLSKVTIEAIPSRYGNTYGDTAYSSGLLNGLTAHTYRNDIDAAFQITGTMPDNGAVSATLDTTTTSYTVPSGYHNGAGSVSIALESKSATPSTSSQTIVPSTGSVLSAVTINAIPSDYQDVTGVTAVASHVLTGDVFVDASGSEVTGTMANNSAFYSLLTAGSSGVFIPEGYHNGNGRVYISPEDKIAIPSTVSQIITASALKVLDRVTVEAIPSNFKDITGVTAAASQVLAGTSFVNSTGVVAGTMPNIGAASSVLDTSHTNYTIPSGYHNGSGVVSLVTETKSVTPTTSSQNITPASGKVLSSVTVAAIPSQYQDVSNVDAAAGDVLSGKIIVDATGAEITGTMANNGAISGSIDGLTTLSYTIPSGYHNGSGTVSLTSDIETALAAI